jgi:transposase-like protein
MGKYTEEYKAAIERRMMPPISESVVELSRETGVTTNTLYTWRKQNRAKGVVMPGKKKKAESWSSEEKFEVVVQTYAMNEAEISEYCRKRGLYREQIAAWRQACKKANATAGQLEKTQHSIAREEKKKVKELSRELRRKEKALAEAAALLILKKKANALWGAHEDER